MNQDVVLVSTLGTRGFSRVVLRGRTLCRHKRRSREKKTSGAERFDLLCKMELDLVSNLSIKPAVSCGDHKHMNEMADFSQEKMVLRLHLVVYRKRNKKKGLIFAS